MATDLLYPAYGTHLPKDYRGLFANPDCDTLNWALGKDIDDQSIYRHARRILLHHARTLTLRDARFLLSYIDAGLRKQLKRTSQIPSLARKANAVGFVGDYMADAVKPFKTPFPTVEALQGKDDYFAFLANTRVGGPTTLVVSNVISQRNGYVHTCFLDSYHSNSESIRVEDVLAIGSYEHGTHTVPGWSGRYVLLQSPEKIKALTGSEFVEYVPYLPSLPEPPRRIKQGYQLYEPFVEMDGTQTYRIKRD